MIDYRIRSFLKRIQINKIENETLTNLLQHTQQEWHSKQKEIINTFNIRHGALMEQERNIRKFLFSETITEKEYLEEKQKVAEEIVQLEEQKLEVSSKKMKTLKKYEYFLKLTKNPKKTL